MSLKIRMALLGVCLAGATAACRRAPEHQIRLQGTVTSIGYGLPVTDAQVTLEWPRTLGGGTTLLKTDGQGHFAAGRTVRTNQVVCKGVTITIRASGFASAYHNSAEECQEGLLTVDFKLFPMTR